MAESYKSVICSIFLGKPNSLSVLRYNLLTFRGPALQSAHSPPPLAAHRPHTEYMRTHEHGQQGHTSYEWIQSPTCILACAHGNTDSDCTGLRKGKRGKEKEREYRENG